MGTLETDWEKEFIMSTAAKSTVKNVLASVAGLGAAILLTCLLMF